MRRFRPDQVTRFQVETEQDGRVEVSTISIEYTLKGVVAFPFPAFHHEIPVGAKEAELRLPLLVTAPVVGSDLDVETELNALPELLRDAEIDNKWWIVLPVDPSLLQKDISLFKVKISDATTGRIDETTVSLTRVAAFRVSPRTMRFRRTDDEGYLAASSIIHVARVSNNSDSIATQKAKDRARCSRQLRR